MAKEIKTIGVLTSGGDAPGMNAAVRAIVRAGISKGYRMMGIQRGYNGLINGECYEMNVRSVSEIIHRGGTILYTARCLEFKTKEGQAKGLARCKELGIDALVVIGGDGSFRGARDLSQRGIPCVGLPGTIDNDIACCDYTIGYDTCMNTIMEMVDRIRDTAESHDRCMVVEVMGRRAGYLALNAGIAVGATAILIPEIEFDIQKDVIERMKRTLRTDKKHFLIIVAEGVGINVNELAKEIQAKTGVESRACVLGHVQRGGSPTARDRVLATQMGNYAVKNLLMKGIGNRVVAIHQDKIVDYDIFEALNMEKHIDPELYQTALEVSI
jgi:6-phosphofructokinase 1